MAIGVNAMINEVVSAVCTALYDEFGYEVHKERIGQDMKEPCFMVECISPDIEQAITNRKRHSYQFAITFFPELDEPYKAINDAIERLYDSVGEISVEGDKVCGKDVSTAITDDVLTFTITYDFFMITPDSEENMEDMELKTTAKEAADGG